MMILFLRQTQDDYSVVGIVNDIPGKRWQEIEEDKSQSLVGEQTSESLPTCLCLICGSQPSLKHLQAGDERTQRGEILPDEPLRGDANA